MGQNIQHSSYTEENHQQFKSKLREETKVLMAYFKDKSFEDFDVPMSGLEMEGWLVDKDYLPLPKAKDFLDEAKHEDIVPEISQFNFEVNTPPRRLENKVFSEFHQTLKDTWKICQSSAKSINARPMLIGSLPTIRKEMLSLEYLYPNMRYKALNDQIISQRQKSKINIDIKGKEELSEIFNNLMIEAAATSFQIHLQVSLDKAKDFYNASILASPFVSAVSANAPFLFGKTLWSDTRIPIFEQAVSLSSYINRRGDSAQRVTLGNDYLKRSLFELYLDNLDGYPPLLPEIFEECPTKLKHLCFHNGTIWRWNRPIIGFNKEGTPHLRIEHRVPSAGPSFADMIANMAFFMGCVHFFAKNIEKFQKEINFEQAKENFYQACQYGFNAQCHWIDGKKNLQNILIDELLPEVRKQLTLLNIDKDDINYYFNDIIEPRVLAGQNGSNWQRAFVNTHGNRYQELLEIYYENQEKDLPIHLWKA